MSVGAGVPLARPTRPDELEFVRGFLVSRCHRDVLVTADDGRVLTVERFVCDAGLRARALRYLAGERA